MKRLTDIAVRLRIICSSLLSILGFIALGMLVGLWIGYYRPPAAPAISTSEHDPSSRIPANLKWCDAEHKVPYIAAAACGGGSSCERASSSLEMDDHTDWTAFCAHLTQQLTQ